MRDLLALTSPIALRPHQERAIDLLRESLGKGNRRVVLSAPTGFGKTITAAHIIERVLAKGREVLFTVPRLSLVGQAVDDFLRHGIEHLGVIQANHRRTDATAPVQVASLQTLLRRVPTKPYGLVIVDECHETFAIVPELMQRWPDTHFVGLSATPWARGMGKHWQDLCVATTIRELIDCGFLSQFTVFAPDVPDLSGVKTVAGDYAESGLEAVMADSKLVGSVVETWLRIGGNRPTLCFGVNRAHARVLREEFMRAGVSAAYCDAFTDAVERDHIKRQFVSGEVKVACSVRTLTTGIDWPVSCIVDAAPTKSEMLHVQKIGRGLRVNPGTEDLVILDHASNSLRLGLVTDIHKDWLDDGERKPKGERRAKAARLPKPCVSCGVLYTGLMCVSCGHERKPVAGVETVDGDLVVLSGKKVAASQEQRAAWYAGLLTIAAVRKRSLGWVAHTYHERFKCWPRGLDPCPGPASAEMWNFVKAKDIRFAKRRGSTG